MKRLVFYFLIFAFYIPLPVLSQQNQVRYWVTSGDRTQLLKEQPGPLHFSQAKPNPDAIVVDASKKFQTIDGFGFALTGGSAQHIIQMDAADQKKLLREIFGKNPGDISVSYLRISIGASDLNERVFTYDDMPEGQT
ncbi:MAG TPA: hypothetical protein VGM24_04495, partial [Puia sp.]